QQQAISRAYRNGLTKFAHVYRPVASKWEVDKIDYGNLKVRRIYFSRNEVNTEMDPSCSVS
ncbi:hypothetical protein HAX54_051753, partial [Datura stramonium]|nr:hypothetical protein [Datura stramonium]